MAAAAFPAGPRRAQRDPDVRLLSPRAQNATAARLLQWLATLRLQLGGISHHPAGAVGTGYLQAGAAPLAIETIRRVRRGSRRPSARAGLYRDVRRKSHRAGAAASARAVGDDHRREAWLG